MGFYKMIRMGVLLLILLPLTGCWDQRLLKDSLLLIASGFDVEDNGNVRLTMAVLSPRNKVLVFSGTGLSPHDARNKLEERMPGRLDNSNNRLVLIGEAAAKKGIYPLLDIFFRDPSSALNANIGVVKGSAEKYFTRHAKDKMETLQNIDKMFTDKRQTNHIPLANIQSICPIFLDPGEDIILPYLADEKGDLSIIGNALFNGLKMTGTLEKDESILCMLLKGSIVRTASFTFPVKGKKGPASPLSFQIYNNKRKLQVKAGPGGVDARIDLKLNIEIMEYPPDNLSDQDTAGRIEGQLADELTSRSRRVLEKLQKADCDFLGIGRRVIAYYPSYWKETDWDKDYPKAAMTPEIRLHVLKHGILN
ncbi:Ger(x)C family spore germination protein [Paenibacillus aurantius]|uniref:Ger(X)C family spore germination protein n=1 Tax=Paenibacillus aurantius TaxID=2918900 RepID=A0AA96REV2_9BACL|nr:Ger(x)C family spore germination protein [Paenibacillus aurantius]WNQ10588.1 Ger(x)C family spore germination protein [Paenibacillus aurantius]